MDQALYIVRRITHVISPAPHLVRLIQQRAHTRSAIGPERFAKELTDRAALRLGDRRNLFG